MIFNPEAQAADPLFGAILEFNQPAGTVYSLRAGLRAMRAQREYVAAFMDCYLVKHPGPSHIAMCRPATSRTDRDNPAFDRGLALTRGLARNRTVHLARANPGNPVKQRHAR